MSGTPAGPAEAVDAAPRDLDTVLSPEWLTFALFGRSGTHVLDVRVIETITVAATKVRFEIDTDDAAEPTVALCVKGFFTAAELSPINSRVAQAATACFGSMISPVR